MRCPNCYKHFDGGKLCPHCKIDVRLFNGIETLSNRLYNRGLRRLQSQDLTAGIRELERAVAINKHNIRARNLLGLALFEMGYIADALKNWLISRKQVSEGNPANHYLDAIKRDPRLFERHNEAVTLYNRALELVQEKKLDIAIIQLKKSLEYNKRYVPSLNLLTLCYIQERNRPQAISSADRVLTIDAKNPFALRYLAIVNPTKPATVVKQVTQPTQPIAPKTILPPTDTSPFGKVAETGPFKSINISDKKPSYFHAVGILSFIAGALLMMAFGFFLYLPAVRREHNLNLQYEQRTVAALTQAHEEELYLRDNTEYGLRNRIDDLEYEIDDWQHRYSLVNATIIVTLANDRFRAGSMADFRAAMVLLDLVDLDILHFDVYATARHIIDTSRPQLATHYVQQGINSFNTGDYDRALILLEDARRFIDPGNVNYPALLYFLGTLYYRAPNRQADAIATLQRLTSLEVYATLPATPWSARRTRVTTMLSNMGIN